MLPPNKSAREEYFETDKGGWVSFDRMGKERFKGKTRNYPTHVQSFFFFLFISSNIPMFFFCCFAGSCWQVLVGLANSRSRRAWLLLMHCSIGSFIMMKRMCFFDSSKHFIFYFFAAGFCLSLCSSAQ